MTNNTPTENQNNSPEFKFFKPMSRLTLIFFIGFTIFITVSTIMLIFLTKSSKEIIIPDITGKRFVDVSNNLTRKGINPEIKFKDVYDIDDGIILNQSPENGVVVLEGSPLKLIVSRSKNIIEVPNLTGVELPIAINKLHNLHYKEKTISISIGVISYIPSDKVSDNIVIEQIPKAKEKISPDRKINILVSSGDVKQNNKMPSVKGQSISLCYDLLAAKELFIDEEIIKTSKIEDSGIVVSQNPAKGKKLKKGDIVKLKIKHYSLKDSPYNAFEKFSFTTPAKDGGGLYEALIEDSSKKRIRFARIMKPGKKIEFIFYRTGNAKVTILKDKKIIRVNVINVEEY